MIRVETGELPVELLAELRGYVPRQVGVTGAADAAAAAEQLHRAGFAVVVYSDEVVAFDSDIPVRPITDRGPAMEVVDSLVGLVGNTPLVRLDRVGRDLDCHLIAKLEFMNPGGSVKD